MSELIVGGGRVGETGWKISPDFRSPEVGIPASWYSIFCVNGAIESK